MKRGTPSETATSLAMRVATTLAWRVNWASSAQAGSPTKPARWTTAEALRAAKVSLAISVTSPSMSSKKGWCANSANDSRPYINRSSTLTRKPCFNRSSTVDEPM